MRDTDTDYRLNARGIESLIMTVLPAFVIGAIAYLFFNAVNDCMMSAFQPLINALGGK